MTLGDGPERQGDSMAVAVRERDQVGRFARKGPRPGLTQEVRDQYLRTMSSVATVEEWQEITRKAVEDAKLGNWRARDWLSNYLLGKATQYVETEVTRFEESLRLTVSSLSDKDLGALLAIAQSNLIEGGEGAPKPE